METERLLKFYIFSNNNEKLLSRSKCDTVGSLKELIAQEFNISKSRLVITGWKLPPDDDNDILAGCSHIEELTILEVKDRGWDNIQKTPTEEVLEEEACINVWKEVKNNCWDSGITFHVDLLKNKIAEVCLGPLEQRKVVLLYLHNKNDTFTTMFWQNIKRPEIVEIINKSCCFIGWDINNENHHCALVNALIKCELDHIVPYIARKTGSAFCIVTDLINGKVVVTVQHVLNKYTSEDNFQKMLLQAEKFQIKIKQSTPKTIINSQIIQQNFANLLGDRDYDLYQYDEHEYLKKNIAYALYGPPLSVEGYSNGYQAIIDNLYTKIVDKTNEVTEFKDNIELAIIYNCTQPPPEVKKSKEATNPEYDADADVIPYPVFIIRRCHESENPCRIFIDHMGRVYKNWEEYLQGNKLPKCIMCVPKGGRYEVDKKEIVILETRFSPACGIGTKILNVLDIGSVVTGLTSGGVGLTTTMLSGTAIAVSTPALAVALPVVGVAAAVGGIASGIYSVVRSSMNIHDRRLREESLNFFESSEARGAYLNIIAGSLSFVGAGTNVVFSRLVSNGVQIGTSAKIAVNTINMIELAGGGISVVNSVHDVIRDYVVNDERPSPLMILQLTSNILFFGHSVFRFRTAGTIIDETQARVLKEYNDSLRSNRHRKTLKKIISRTLNKNDGNVVKARAEVIAALRNIQNKDETFAAITRNLKRLKENNIQVSAKDGSIFLNDIPIDVNEFCQQKGNEVFSYLSQLATRTEITPNEVSFVETIFNSFENAIPNLHDVSVFAAKFLSSYPNNIKGMIIEAVVALLKHISQPVLKQLTDMIPLNRVYCDLFLMVVQFFSKSAEDLEKQYKQWNHSRSEKDYQPVFDYVNMDKLKRYVAFMEKSVEWCFELLAFKEVALRKLVTFFYEWFAKKFCEYQEEKDRRNKMKKHSASSSRIRRKKSCTVCQGYYFQAT